VKLTGRRIVLGVSGGVAAYKAVELCRLLMDAGAYVSPVLTENATRFIGAPTFSALATEPARVSLWNSPEPSPHTSLASGADLIIVAPATARAIAAYTHGFSDDLLTATLLASRSPVVLCPAMHTEMWEHPSVVDNIALLRRRGVHIVDPDSGHLAGGDDGVGRMAEPARIMDYVEDLTTVNRDLIGRRVIVTAGGTREPVDPVRYIGNRSSGKQGHAIARAAVERGAQVILVTASHLEGPTGVRVQTVDTAAEMHAVVMQNLTECDALVMAAAVADFRAASPGSVKMRKDEGVPSIDLVPTVDILDAVAGERKSDQVIVGFAAETGNGEDRAWQKMKRKRLDIVVLNDVTVPTSGFDYDTNSAIILAATGERVETGLVDKRVVADRLLDLVTARLDERSPLTRPTPLRNGSGAERSSLLRDKGASS